MEITTQVVEAKINANGKFSKYFCVEDEESICLLTLPGLYQISFRKPIPEDIETNKITEPVKYVLQSNTLSL